MNREPRSAYIGEMTSNPTPVAKPPVPRFIAALPLGRLARSLRFMGYDTAWSSDPEAWNDATLTRLALEERRWLLTNDRELHERHVAGGGSSHCLQTTVPDDQLRELVTRFELERWLKPFSLCLDCNSVILPAKPHQVHERVSGSILAEHEEFYLCPRCERVHWKGSHYDRTIARIQAILK